jgi:hypothetical protein
MSDYENKTGKKASVANLDKTTDILDDQTSEYQELTTLSLTSFTELFGTQWRWPLFLQIVKLLKNFDVVIVKPLDKTLIIDTKGLNNKMLLNLFDDLSNTITKLCQVEVRIKPYSSNQNCPENSRKYMISIF